MPKENTNNGIARLQNSLLASKWMITPIALKSLMQSVDTVVANTMLASDVIDGVNNQPLTADEADSIGVIHVAGILAKNPSALEKQFLGMLDVDDVSKSLDAFANDPNISNIVLVFSSPGGETTGIEELGRKIARIDAKTKPVYAWTEQQACSAAYWLASQARSIGMTPSATVGSIGVYSVIVDETKALETAGVEVVSISSGKYKMIGHSFHTLTDEEKSILQDDVNKQHQKFKDAIQSKRSTVSDEYMQGLSYEGQQALEYNLVDYVGDSLNEFINSLSMKTEIIKASGNAASVHTDTVAVAAEVTTNAVDATNTTVAEVADSIPENPGTEKEVTCPHCKGQFAVKMDDHNEPDGDEAPEIEDSKAVSAEVKTVAEAPATPAVVAEAPTVDLSLEAWHKALGLNAPKKSNNTFQEAARLAFSGYVDKK